VREALSTLPWVEQDSVQANVDKKEVRFAVKDPKEFDLKAVQAAIGDKGFKEVNLLAGPGVNN
jgi:hypothetical protein